MSEKRKIGSDRADISEKKMEQQLVRAVKAAGGICPKWVSPGWDGVPDRIVLLPGGRIVFAELKAPGGKPRPLQLARHRQLRRLGFKVYVIDSADQIDGVLDGIGGRDGYDFTE